MKAKIVFPALIAGLTFATSCKKDLTNNNNPDDTIQEASTITTEQNLLEINFNSAVFTNPTILNNTYFPYNTIGRRYIFEGESADGFEHDELQRIDANKVIMGIHVAVINDSSSLNGIVEEVTRDWYAQDDAGNVWYMGESTDNYNPDGTIRDHEGSWEAGIKNAKPGIIMLADLKQGVAYLQEFAEGIAEDKAKIEAIGITVQVPFNTYSDCLKTKEWSDLEKGVIEYKFYAPGVGEIKERTHNTSLELVSISG